MHDILKKDGSRACQTVLRDTIQMSFTIDLVVFKVIWGFVPKSHVATTCVADVAHICVTQFYSVSLYDQPFWVTGHFETSTLNDTKMTLNKTRSRSSSNVPHVWFTAIPIPNFATFQSTSSHSRATDHFEESARNVWQVTMQIVKVPRLLVLICGKMGTASTTCRFTSRYQCRNDSSQVRHIHFSMNDSVVSSTYKTLCRKLVTNTAGNTFPWVHP